ncbi:unnamed protein product, partial [Oppiella nova]
IGVKKYTLRYKCRKQCYREQYGSGTGLHVLIVNVSPDRAHLPVLLLNLGLKGVVLLIAHNVRELDVLGLNDGCAPGVPPGPVVDRLRQEGLRPETGAHRMSPTPGTGPLGLRPSLRLSRASLGKATVGHIVNLMSNDVSRFDAFSMDACYLLVAPIQTAIAIYIIYTEIGYYCFVGVALLLLFMLFQAFMSKLISKVRLMTAQLTDSRLRLMNEIISGMRVIKMYAWEQSFAELVATSRKNEVHRLQMACFLKAINLSVYLVASRIILFACFITYVLSGTY